MIVRAKLVDIQSIPQNASAYLPRTGGGWPRVSPSLAYEVDAVAVFNGVVFVLVADDDEVPRFLPGCLFDVEDGSTPRDWRCSVFATEPSLVIGPDFVSSSIESYVAMVEGHVEQVRAFWQRRAPTAQHTHTASKDGSE